MKRSLHLLLLCFLTHLTGAEFSINFREASVEPRAGFAEHDYKPGQKIYVGPDSGLSAGHVAKLTYHNSSGEHVLGITFTAVGAPLNHAFTTRMLRQPIAVFINGKLVSTPKVLAASSDECWISGPSKDEIDRYIASFESR